MSSNKETPPLKRVWIDGPLMEDHWVDVSILGTNDNRAHAGIEYARVSADEPVGEAARMKSALLARLWAIQSDRVADETPEETMKIDALLSTIAADLEQVEVPATPSHLAISDVELALNAFEDAINSAMSGQERQSPDGKIYTTQIFKSTAQKWQQDLNKARAAIRASRPAADKGEVSRRAAAKIDAHISERLDRHTSPQVDVIASIIETELGEK